MRPRSFRGTKGSRWSLVKKEAVFFSGVSTGKLPKLLSITLTHSHTGKPLLNSVGHIVIIIVIKLSSSSLLLLYIKVARSLAGKKKAFIRRGKKLRRE